MKSLTYLITLLITSISLSAQNANTCTNAHLADSAFMAKLCSSAQNIIYVKSTGLGNGSSWSNACNLDSAMNLAAQTPDTHVLVEAGTYYLTKTLTVPPHTVLHGGFSDAHDNISGWHRHYSIHTTILDAQHYFGVVRLGVGAELNGFTVQNGLASMLLQPNGGGVYMESGSAVRNCYISNNMALNHGGGIYSESDGLVVNTLFVGNKAGVDGLAVYGTTCIFRNNTVSENTKIEYESVTEKEAKRDSTLLKPTICSGTTATLNVLDTGAYLWNTGETTSSITTPALSSNTTYTCTVTTPDKDAVFVLSFVVYVKPQPTLTVVANKTIANVGDTVMFSAIADPLGGSYLWDDPKGTMDSVLLQVMPENDDLRFICNYTFDGCKAVSNLSEGTVTNTKCTPPTEPTSLTADFSEVCSPSSVTLRLSGGERNSGQWALYADSCGGVKLDSILGNETSFQVNPTLTTTYYVRGEGCGVQTTCVEATIKVNPLPADIIGDADLCRGSVRTYTTTSVNGSWMSSSPAIAAVNTVSGEVTALAVGTSMLSYTYAETGCSISKSITVHQQPARITGSRIVCENNFMQLNNTTSPAGVWIAEPKSIVSVDVLGMVHGLTAGEAVVTYTLGFCSDTFNIRVAPAITSITVVTALCEGSCTTASVDTIFAGGLWQSSDTSVATVVVTSPTAAQIIAHKTGTYDLTYVTPEGCSVTSRDLVVNSLTTITTHPSATNYGKDQNTGNFPELSVTAIGTAPLSYQWYSNTMKNNIGGTLVSGATSSTYTPDTKNVGSVYYYCEVSNSCGSVQSAVSGVHATRKPIVITGCNGNTPGWGTDLGTISFGSAHETVISGNGITQIWSGPVSASRCHSKTTYSINSAATDCRNNPSSAKVGDFFSWCAVARFANVLCPAPWRVPTKEDFINLDKALGGTGANSQVNSTLLKKYTGVDGTSGQVWNGMIAGGVNSSGEVQDWGVCAVYWSSTEVNATRAYYLSVHQQQGSVSPQISNSKMWGSSLRCIKDN